MGEGLYVQATLHECLSAGWSDLYVVCGLTCVSSVC
jgi:hypothetical protein